MGKLAEADAAAFPLQSCVRSLGCDGLPPSTSSEADKPTPLYAISPDGRTLVIAYAKHLAFCVAAAHDIDANRSKALPCSGLVASEYITALRVLAWRDEARRDVAAACCAVLGTSLGFLQLHACSGAMLIRMPLHSGPAQQIHLRTEGGGLQPASLAEHVSLAFPDALVRLYVEDLRALLHRRGSGGGGVAIAPTAHKWLLPASVGPRADGVLLGLRPPTLATVLDGRSERKARQVLMMTSGSTPPLVTLKGQEQYNEYNPGMYHIATTYASSITAGAFATLSAARSMVAGGRQHGDAAVEEADAGRSTVQSHKPPVGLGSKPYRSWMEEQRTVTCLAPSPRGVLVAAADSVGRVAVVDCVTCGVVRLWKGYRDAQIAWLLLPAGRPHLVILSPWKAVVEVWPVPSGSRCASWPLPELANGAPSPQGRPAALRYVLLSSGWCSGGVPAAGSGAGAGMDAVGCWLADASSGRVWSLGALLRGELAARGGQHVAR